VLLEVVRDDITRLRVDAVVTAANEALRGGGGVDGAVHAACGPELVRASRALAPCPAGSAVVTRAFDLEPQVRWVVHAVGPIWSGAPDDAETLASAYRASLARADEVRARSIAFPAISTGVYGYPKQEAAQVAVRTLRAARTDVERCLLVAFDTRTARLYEAELARS
jgi:O-acetyl-ADP-ribose deacetylase